MNPICKTCGNPFKPTPRQLLRMERGLSVDVCRNCYRGYVKKELGAAEEEGSHNKTNSYYRGPGSFGSKTTKEKKV